MDYGDDAIELTDWSYLSTSSKGVKVVSIF